VIHYPEYQPRDRTELVELFASQRAVRLVTLARDGAPRIGLYPFLAWADVDPIRLEVHLVRGDAQAQDLARDPRCAIEVDEVLSFVPSHWQGDDNAMHADLYYRFAAVACTARLVDEPGALAGHLSALLARYQPEGRHLPVTADTPLYESAMRRLVLVRVEAVQPPLAKFKLGQRATAEERQRVAAGLDGAGEVGRRTLRVLARQDPP
jgi:transcriptional regulator